MAEMNRESLLRLFSFEKKSELERYCDDLTISSGDFVQLILDCEFTGQPFLHAITVKEDVSPELIPKNSEVEALNASEAGTTLTKPAAKAVRKMIQSIKQRQYSVGHMFFTPDATRWHFFFFAFADLEPINSHWTFGPHVHFVNWLWPHLTAELVWSKFETEGFRPGPDIHLRFVEETKERPIMRIKKLEFNGPVEQRSSTGLHAGGIHSPLFDEDVFFKFEVQIDGSKRDAVEQLLLEFDRASAKFKEVWQKKLETLQGK